MNNKAFLRGILFVIIAIFIITVMIAYIKFNKGNLEVPTGKTTISIDYNSTPLEKISIIGEQPTNITNISNSISQNNSIAYANLSEEINSTSQ